jgi:PKD repeat protein
VWFPAHPRVGETVTFASTATDPGSPITSFAWDLQGKGAFTAGGSGDSTRFTTAGGHQVQLRVTDAAGRSAVSSQTVPVAAAMLPELNPFPVVRIVSSDTGSGVRVKLLSVIAPANASVTVACHGRRGCPVRVQSHAARARRPRTTVVEFRRFERALPAGVYLEITVTARGRTGKYTKFVVRRHRLPLRIDGCVAGFSAKPIACPSP